MSGPLIGDDGKLTYCPLREIAGRGIVEDAGGAEFDARCVGERCVLWHAATLGGAARTHFGITGWCKLSQIGE